MFLSVAATKGLYCQTCYYLDMKCPAWKSLHLLSILLYPCFFAFIFLYPFGIDLIVWHPRVAIDGEITRTLKLPRLPAYTLNVTLSSMPASGHKSDLCDRPKHWQLGSRAACRVWESNTLQLYTASIYFYIDVYKRLRTEVRMGHAIQFHVPVIYVLIYCSTFCLVNLTASDALLTQNYTICYYTGYHLALLLSLLLLLSYSSINIVNFIFHWFTLKLGFYPWVKKRYCKKSSFLSL